MSVIERENEMKLEILSALSRSQQAIASIIESMGEAAAHSPPLSLRMLEQLDAIRQYQLAIGTAIAGIRLRHPRQGSPGEPWMNQELLSSSR